MKSTQHAGDPTPRFTEKKKDSEEQNNENISVTGAPSERSVNSSQQADLERTAFSSVRCFFSVLRGRNQRELGE